MNVQKTSPLQPFPKMDIKEAAAMQTMQNFTFPCLLILSLSHIHLDKKKYISSALSQHDLQQEDIIKLFCFASCLAAVRHDLETSTFKCCVKRPTLIDLEA